MTSDATTDAMIASLRGDTSAQRAHHRLPDYYGRPIDTPPGFRWAGYRR